jgi:hypothetical protein
MKSGGRLRTHGFGLLSLDEQQQFQRELRARSIDFRLVGKGAGQEVSLLKASVDGDLSEVIRNLLAKFGLAIG